MRSIHFMKDKEVFDIKRYNHKAYAESLGIMNPPVISFKSKGSKEARVITN